MAGEQIVVTGLDELNAKCKRISKDSTKALRKAEKEAARIVSDEARSVAPRLTGKLANSVKPSATNKGAFVKTGNLIYAKPIHFGWPAHNIEPQPFLYDALDSRKAEVLAKFNQGIEDLIK